MEQGRQGRQNPVVLNCELLAAAAAASSRSCEVEGGQIGENLPKEKTLTEENASRTDYERGENCF